MEIEQVQRFMEACHESKKIIGRFPKLPKCLSQRHIKALAAIQEQKEKNEMVKVSDVSKSMGGTSPSITKLLHQLEQAGAIRKKQDEIDKRVIWLEITPLGKTYYEFYCSQYHVWLGKVLQEIQEADIEVTIRTIHRAFEILQANPIYGKEESNGI
jgi:DNA-binding MarR family transcriptional regulator